VRNRLIQLLADNRNVPERRFEVRVDAGADEAEILVYDAIVDSELEAEWWGGVAPEAFVRAVKGITAGTIHVRINSPGGSVFAARAMETALREHSARIVVHIDSLAASAASFLAMAGDEIRISKGAMVMIHKAWTLAWGNSDELNKTAALLSKIDGTLVETYADRTGKSVAEIADWMAAETWFTAQEAVDAGFADSVTEPVKGQGQGAAPAAQWNLRAYLRPPADSTPAPPPQPAAPIATAEDRARITQRLRIARLLQPVE
jgi:ATP-dependent Clp protease, protease subunit